MDEQVTEVNHGIEQVNVTGSDHLSSSELNKLVQAHLQRYRDQTALTTNGKIERKKTGLIYKGRLSQSYSFPVTLPEDLAGAFRDQLEAQSDAVNITLEQSSQPNDFDVVMEAPPVPQDPSN